MLALLGAGVSSSFLSRAAEQSHDSHHQKHAHAGGGQAGAGQCQRRGGGGVGDSVARIYAVDELTEGALEDF